MLFRMFDLNIYLLLPVVAHSTSDAEITLIELVLATMQSDVFVFCFLLIIVS